MISYLWLLAKRAAILLPGLVVIYVSAWTVYPYLQHRVPFLVALFLTYVLAAYGIIPAIWRMLRLVLPAKHLPLYALTADGFASDPLNVGILGSRKQLIDVMEKAGWHVVEPATPQSIIRLLYATILKRSFPGMPMSNLYLFGRKQDIGFAAELLESGRGHRHHVRFWATTLHDIQEVEVASIKHPDSADQLRADRLLWAGAASRDIGIAVAKGSLQFTHAVSPNTNAERERIVHELESRKLAKLVSTIRLHKPYHLPNFAWSRSLQSDGKMAVLQLQ